MTERASDDAAGATAIVVTYNSSAHIADCLRSLLYAGLQVRVVDNASTDGTADLITGQFPAIPLTANAVNVGFPVAVNQALTSVENDIVVLVNPDTVLPRATAHALVETLRSRPEVDVVGPRLVGLDGRPGFSTGPFESFGVSVARLLSNRLPSGARRALRRRCRLRQYDLAFEDGPPVAVERLSGAMLAVRSDLLRQTGGLDEGYFMYYEDVEVCLAAWQRGAQVVFLPGVEAVHVGGASSTDPAWTLPHLYRSQLRFTARHSPRTFQLQRLTLLVRAVLHVVVGLARRPGLPLARSTVAWLRVARMAFAAHTVAVAIRPYQAVNGSGGGPVSGARPRPVVSLRQVIRTVRAYHNTDTTDDETNQGTRPTEHRRSTSAAPRGAL